MQSEQESHGDVIRRPYPAVIHLLTSLRYLAAAWVVVFHFKEYFPGTALSSAPLATYGFIGVDFFFVLSGFVLAHVYLPRMRAGQFDYFNFLVRRVGRVYPLHILTLVVTLALSIMAAKAQVAYTVWDLGAWMTLPKGDILRALFAHVTMIHAWGSTDGLIFNLPSWSISAEWFAYLLLPVFIIAFRSLLPRPAWFLVASVIVLLVLDAGMRMGANVELLRVTWNLGALRIVPSFVIGIALYRFGESYTVGKRLTVPAFFSAIAALIGIVQLGGPVVLVVMVLAAIVFLCADAERHGGLCALQHPFLVLMGEVSYSVYLWHFPLGVLAFDMLLATRNQSGSLAGLGLIALVLLGITLVSWISYRFVEIPARRAIIAAGDKLALPAAFT